MNSKMMESLSQNNGIVMGLTRSATQDMTESSASGVKEDSNVGQDATS